MRTHTCGALRATDAGAEVVLCGWVARRRDHGGVTFIDLRDREGITQLVFHPDEEPAAHEAAQGLRGEWVVRVVGTVRPRKEGTVNPGSRPGRSRSRRRPSWCSPPRTRHRSRSRTGSTRTSSCDSGTATSTSVDRR
ncbi:MAG: OB-fold nucleic acid binding domain-containing protein [Actinomycetota bacterium]